MEKKRPAEALTLIERHLAAYPRSPGAHTARGEALEASGRAPEAIAEHETALRLATEEEDPDLYGFKEGLARARYKLEKTPR